MRATFKPILSGLTLAVLVLYGVELLDELIYGLRAAALPQIRSDLALTYTEIGLLTAIPGLLALFAEPLVGLLGDTRLRRGLILGGIAAAAIDLLLAGTAQGLPLLLLAYSLGYTASGAYVSLSQATLIDRNPVRSEHTMARWTLIGSVGVAVAPAIVTGALVLGYTWRALYLALGAVAALYLVLIWRQRLATGGGRVDTNALSMRPLVSDLAAALRNRNLIRIVVLTELADFMLDRFLEVTGLYFFNIVGVTLAEASAAIVVLTAFGLAGDLLLVPLLERVNGMKILRASAGVVLLLYVAFLSVPLAPVKFILLGAIGFCTAGWFAVLRGKTYALLPGQSGVIVAVTSLANVMNLFVPLVIGGIADAFGLQIAMWFLALGPVALLIGLRNERAGEKTN